jgi:hypothetical protein
VAFREKSSNHCLITENRNLYNVELYFNCNSCESPHSRCTRLTKLLLMAKLQLPAIKTFRDMLSVPVSAGFPGVSHLCPNSMCHNPDHIVWERAGLNQQRQLCHRLMRLRRSDEDTCVHQPQCIGGAGVVGFKIREARRSIRLRALGDGLWECQMVEDLAGAAHGSVRGGSLGLCFCSCVNWLELSLRVLCACFVQKSSYLAFNWLVNQNTVQSEDHPSSQHVGWPGLGKRPHRSPNQSKVRSLRHYGAYEDTCMSITFRSHNCQN